MTRARAAFLVVLFMALLRCGGGDGRVPIVVYSPHGEDILRQFADAFEAAHPRARVDWFNLPNVAILDRVRAEAGRPNCDVWWGGTATTFTIAADAGLLAPYEPTWSAHLPPEHRDPGFLWCGQFLAPQVIAYNRERMTAEQAPRDWQALAGEAWRGRVVLRYPMPSGSMRCAFAALVEWQRSDSGEVDAGFALLEGLTRNVKRYATDPTELFEAIQKDRDDVVTVWNLTDCLFQRDRYGYPFGVVLPAVGVPLGVDCIALVKKDAAGAEAAERSDLARAFYEFVTGDEALDSLMTDHWRVPARTDVPAERKPAWLRDLVLVPLPGDPANAARNERAWMTRWEETIKPLAGG